MLGDPPAEGPGSPDQATLALGSSAGPEPEPTLWQRAVWLFASPRQAFGLPHRTTIWLIPMILMAALAVTESVLLHDIGMERALAKIESNENIPQEQKEKILDQMRSSEGSTRSEVMGPVFGVVGSAAALLIPALLYLLALNFVLGAQVRFSHVLGVVALASLITLPRELLRLPIILSRHSLDVFFSPAAFVSSEGGIASKVLNRFDVFDLYRLFLLTIGFSVISAKPPGRTAIAVVGLWLLATICVVLFYLSPFGRYAP